MNDVNIFCFCFGSNFKLEPSPLFSSFSPGRIGTWTVRVRCNNQKWKLRINKVFNLSKLQSLWLPLFSTCLSIAVVVVSANGKVSW